MEYFRFVKTLFTIFFLYTILFCLFSNFFLSEFPPISIMCKDRDLFKIVYIVRKGGGGGGRQRRDWDKIIKSNEM